MQKKDEELETQKKKKEWIVNLVITNEEKPPKKVLVKGEETLDEWGYRAKNLNNQEELLKALLN